MIKCYDLGRCKYCAGGTKCLSQLEIEYGRVTANEMFSNDSCATNNLIFHVAISSFVERNVGISSFIARNGKSKLSSFNYVCL
jgi:hypothetical protein